MLRLPLNTNLYTIILVCCLLLLCWAKLENNKRFRQYISLLYTSVYIKKASKNIAFFDVFGITTYFVFNLTITLIALPYLSSYLDFGNYTTFFIVFFSITAFYGLKFLIEMGLGYLLEINHFAKLFVFNKISYRNFTVQFLLPIAAYLSYHNLFHSQIAIYLISGVFIWYIINYIIVIKSVFDVILQNWFYFILYICTLEIAPYLLLFKFFKS